MNYTSLYYYYYYHYYYYIDNFVRNNTQYWQYQLNWHLKVNL